MNPSAGRGAVGADAGVPRTGTLAPAPPRQLRSVAIGGRGSVPAAFAAVDAGPLERLASEPALLQLLGLGILALVARAIWVGLSRRAAVALERRALADYLTAVEQVFGGEWREALDRLDAVVERDPRHREARLLRALALADAGRPADAHREHVGLRAAYGLDAGVNERGVARALVDAGRPTEAVEVLTALLRRRPDDRSARALLVRAAHAADRHDVAVRVGRPLLDDEGRGDPEVRELVGASLRAWAASIGDETDPETLSAVRQMASKGALRDPGLALRLAAHRALSDGRERAVQKLLEPAGEVSAVAAAWSSPRRVDHPLAALAPDPDPALCAPLRDVSRLADALEANPIHVGRLIDAVATRPDPAAAAELRLLAGEFADVRRQVFERAIDSADADAARLLDVLADTPATGEIAARWSEVADLRRAPAANRLAALVRRADRAIASTGWLSAPWPELRRIAIDATIQWRDLAVFDRVLESCSPLEVLQRLDTADDDVLVAFLAAVPAGHVLLEVLLVEPAFSRDAALVDAAIASDDPRPLEDLLIRRGDARAITRRAIARLGEPCATPVAERLLDRLGAGAVEHLVAAFATEDLADPARARLVERLAGAGPAVVGRLCDLFASTPTPIDDAVLDVLERIGSAAIEPLRQAWRSGPLLDRLAPTARERRSHRRRMLVRALGRIGGPRAVAALEELQKAENDRGVRLSVAQALHRLGDRLRRRPRGGPSDD